MSGLLRPNPNSNKEEEVMYIVISDYCFVIPFELFIICSIALSSAQQCLRAVFHKYGDVYDSVDAHAALCVVAHTREQYRDTREIDQMVHVALLVLLQSA
jgi:hypothetical protein